MNNYTPITMILSLVVLVLTFFLLNRKKIGLNTACFILSILPLINLFTFPISFNEIQEVCRAVKSSIIVEPEINYGSLSDSKKFLLIIKPSTVGKCRIEIGTPTINDEKFVITNLYKTQIIDPDFISKISGARRQEYEIDSIGNDLYYYLTNLVYQPAEITKPKRGLMGWEKGSEYDFQASGEKPSNSLLILSLWEINQKIFRLTTAFIVMGLCFALFLILFRTFRTYFNKRKVILSHIIPIG